MWCFITFSPAGWYMGRWRLKTFVTSCGLSRATVTYFLPFFFLIYTNFLSHGDIFFALFSPFFSLIHANFLTNFHQFSGDIFFAFFLSQLFSLIHTYFFSLIFPNFSRISSYILKADVLDVRTPQKIQIFRRKIVWERKNYQSQSLKPNNSAMCYK